MNINKIINIIEFFAPPETQESWDCSGWIVDLRTKEVKKVLLCLSVTENILAQAIAGRFDMIISHHPLFSVPLNFNKNIPIYCAHTNLDKAQGGTTDTLIDILGFNSNKAQNILNIDGGDFLRLVELEKEIPLDNFINNLKIKLNLKTLRVVNNLNKQTVKKIAFCAGSGADFAPAAREIGADILVTGDVKYHTALDSRVIITDIGHFESEHPVLNSLRNLLKNAELEVKIADEKSPFINY
jgi:GTP cyclohydrolase I